VELERAIASFNLVGLDSSAFIYLYESHPLYYPVIRQVFARMDTGSLRAVTSLVTLLEVTVLPIRQKRQDLVDIYSKVILNAPNLSALPLSVPITQKAAELRATYNLRTPDAIQIATAIVAGAQAFISNDFRLQLVNELPILVIADFT
jgi:predicted nucleic acid-binding protein